MGIANNILQYQADLGERKSYAMNLESNNFKNELHQAVNTANLDLLAYMCSCLYIKAKNA